MTKQNGVNVWPNAAIWMRDELRSKVRFLGNGLLLNSDKTEAVLFRHLHSGRRKVPTANSIDISGTAVPLRDTVKLLV